MNHKNSEVTAWEKWITSERGEECSAGTTTGKYLKNRLRAAFMAGRDSVKEDQANKDPN